MILSVNDHCRTDYRMINSAIVAGVVVDVGAWEQMPDTKGMAMCAVARAHVHAHNHTPAKTRVRAFALTLTRMRKRPRARARGAQEVERNQGKRERCPISVRCKG